MTVSLAAEYGPKVRVNAIQAGPFLTDISKAWPQEMRERAGNALGQIQIQNEILAEFPLGPQIMGGNDFTQRWQCVVKHESASAILHDSIAPEVAQMSARTH